MRRPWWIAVLFFLAARALFSLELPPSPDGSLPGDLHTIQSFYPRLEGSEGEKRALSFIQSRLASLGAIFTPFDFSDSDFEHSFSSCIRVDVPGRPEGHADPCRPARPAAGRGAKQGWRNQHRPRPGPDQEIERRSPSGVSHGAFPGCRVRGQRCLPHGQHVVSAGLPAGLSRGSGLPEPS